MRNRFKNKWYGKHSKLGFSLIEVLVAIAILALLAVPLAQSMITSAQINSQSKNVGSASDMAQTVAESMQATNLGDVLTEVNGYRTNSVGYDLFNTETGEGYSFLHNALKGYSVESSYEVMLLCPGCGARLSNAAIDAGLCDKSGCSAVITDSNITYVPVKRQSDEGVHSDADVTSSIKTRTTSNNVVRTYFTGNADDTYDFVLKNIHTDEAGFDVLVHVEPEQTLQIADISSMSSSDLVNIVEKKDLDFTVAETFVQNHQLYCALRSTTPTMTLEDFRTQMTREIDIDIRNDDIRGTTVITVKAIYTAPDGTLDIADRQITKTIGSFTTNSTSEIADGVYLYYYPLRGHARDTIVVNNPNGFAIKVFLIALNDDKTGEYNPALKFSDLTPTNAASATTFCSNLKDEDFRELPTGVTIKDLSNTSEQQTLYSMSVKVFTHKDNSFTTDGTFTPDDKYLLVSTDATLLDASEKFTVDVDTELGNPIPEEPEGGEPGDNPGQGDDDIETNPTRGYAEASGQNFKYDGTEHDVRIDTNGDERGQFVEWSGDTTGTNAGTYYAYAKPTPGHTWPNGTTGKRQIAWTIERANDATAEGVDAQYTGTEHTGYVGTFVTASGEVTKTEAGYYTISVVPEPNHAWEDGSYGKKEIHWSITPRAVTLTWATGPNQDSWQYDGEEHHGTCTIDGLIDGDECDANIRDNRILQVGTVTAKVTSLSNPNYALPDNGTTHDLTVYGAEEAEITMKDASNGVESLIYNGQERTGVAYSHGVSIEGVQSAIDAGTYQIRVTPLPGYAWDAAGNDKAPRDFEWKILQKEVSVEWGTLEWQYDGTVHSTTCEITNLIEGTQCEVEISNNAILDAGTKAVHATLTNENYTFPARPTQDQSPDQTLTVHALQDAWYDVSDPVTYDGQLHRWGLGEHVDVEGTRDSIDAGTFEVHIKPTKNHTWPGGGTDTKVERWTIKSAEIAAVYWRNYCYTGKEIIGVTGNHIDFGTGTWKATQRNSYSVQVTPSKNYAWAKQDGFTYKEQDRSTRTITWKIEGNTVIKPDPTNPILNFGAPITEFEYNGTVRSPLVSTVDGTLKLTDPVFQNNAYYKVEGTISATNAGKYTARIVLRDKTNSSWASGGTDDIVINWEITKRKITMTIVPHVGQNVEIEQNDTYGGSNLKIYRDVAYRKQYDGTSFADVLQPGLASSQNGRDGDVWLTKDETHTYKYDFQADECELTPLATNQNITFKYGKSNNKFPEGTTEKDCNNWSDVGVYEYVLEPHIYAGATEVTHNYEITNIPAWLVIYKKGETPPSDEDIPEPIDPDDPFDPIPEPYIPPTITINHPDVIYTGSAQNLFSISNPSGGGTWEFTWEVITYKAATSYSADATLNGDSVKLKVDTGFDGSSVTSPGAIEQLNGAIDANGNVTRQSWPGWSSTIPTGVTKWDDATGTTKTFSDVGTRAGKYVVYWRFNGDQNNADYWDPSWYAIVNVLQAPQTIALSTNTIDKCHNHVSGSLVATAQENPVMACTTSSFATTSIGDSSRVANNNTSYPDSWSTDRTITVTTSGTAGSGTITINVAATENYKKGTKTFNVYSREHLHNNVVRSALNTYVSAESYSATCVSNGLKRYKCLECGDINDVITEKTGHNCTKSSSGGTWCTTPITTTSTCTNPGCNYSTSSTTPAAYTNHNYLGPSWADKGPVGHEDTNGCNNLRYTVTKYRQLPDGTWKPYIVKVLCKHPQPYPYNSHVFAGYPYTESRPTSCSRTRYWNRCSLCARKGYSDGGGASTPCSPSCPHNKTSKPSKPSKPGGGGGLKNQFTNMLK